MSANERMSVACAYINLSVNVSVSHGPSIRVFRLEVLRIGTHYVPLRSLVVRVSLCVIYIEYVCVQHVQTAELQYVLCCANDIVV